MAFEFIQIPANGQGSAKEELNKLLRNGRIASVKNKFLPCHRHGFGGWQSRWDWRKSNLGIVKKTISTCLLTLILFLSHLASPIVRAEVPIQTERDILRTDPVISYLRPAGPNALATDGSRVYAGASGYDGFYSDGGGVFVFDAATSTQLAIWGDSALGNGDRFGESIALANGVLAVGAPRDDDAAQDAGAVYLLDAATGARLARIINPETTTRSFDYFGQILCLSSKWLAIASPNDDDVSNNSGAVFLYQVGAEKSTWTFRHKFVPTAGSSSGSHSFGEAIAILDDLIFIGDPEDSFGAVGLGAVHVFDAVTGGLRQLIRPQQARYEMAFGSSLAANDRVLAVGAVDDPGVIYAGGSVALYDPVSFAFRMEIHPPGLENGDHFGAALALRDGSLAISSPGESNPAGSYTAGAIYLAGATDGSLFLRCRSGTSVGDPIIGISIALAPQLLVAGAPDHDSTLIDSGSVFTFDPTRSFIPPEVTNVRAAQIPGTHQVRITYDLSASASCTVGVQAWLENPGTSLVLPPAALSGDVTGPEGIKVSPGLAKSITVTVAETTSIGTTVKAPDLHNLFTKSLKFKVIATP